LALVLAATGIYALLAWSVSRRTREIGIRVAIGAAPSDVVRMVLRRALQPAMAGVLAGAGGAMGQRKRISCRPKWLATTRVLR
jgi:putative ABC transport system permease protein